MPARSFSIVLLFVLVMTCVEGRGFAQTTTISGTVIDPQGRVVPDAVLTLSQGATLRTTRSAADGKFVLDNVPAGAHTLRVDASGFVTWMEQVTAGPQLEAITINLMIAGVQEDVTVIGARGLNLSRPTATASRLELTPLQTPASLHVISGELIRERGDVAVSEATTRAVGVTTNWTVGNGGGGLSIRGFAGPGAILQLYDGVQLFVGAHTVSFPSDTWSVDRVEVLSGPGSVLYGSGAIGAVVNVVPRQVNTVARQNTGQIGFGSDNTWRAACDSTGPLNSRTAYRVAVSHSRSDGWIERGDSESTALSASLRHQVTPTFSLTFSEDYGYQEPMNYYGVPLIGGRLDESLRRVNYNVTDAQTLFKDNRTHLKAEWALAPNRTLRSNLYYLGVDRLWYRGGNFTYQPASGQILIDRVFEVTHDQFQVGNRTDLVNQGRLFGRDNMLSAGVEYNHVGFEVATNAPGAGSRLVSFPNPSPPSFTDLALSPTLPRYSTRTNALGLFAEDRLVIGPSVSLVGGVRGDYYQIDRRDLVTLADTDRSFTPTSWRGGVVYNVRPDMAVYGQVSTAVQTVGELISQSAGEQVLDLMTGSQVEAGVKQSMLNNRVEWTVAAYRLVRDKLVVPDPNFPAVLQQIGQQSSYGLEVAGAFVPGGNVRIDANGTVLSAQFDDFAEVVAGRTISRNGNRPPNVPLQAANVWATWSPRPAWQLRGGLRYVGNRFIDNANNWIMPAYTVVDAGIRRSFGRYAVDVRLFNALDEVYSRGFWNGNSAAEQWLLGAPRTAEVAVTTSF
jgi:iron complex outermembrane recepter protein